jgi:conjugative relaxase-like TrwC/TraI family protein
MTVSIRRMTLGSGYRYLMSSVAQSDGAGQHPSALTRYYAETGTPPGRFLGAGLAGLADGAGVEPGSQVSEEHLFRMLGKLQDPLTGAQLGQPPRTSGPSYDERVSARILTETLTKNLTGTGEDRAAAVLRIKAEERLRESRRVQTVAGFDLTFSVPKSVSVVWALAYAQTQAIIYEAHQQAVAYVIGYAERHVFHSRSGRHSVVQEDIHGVIAAGFDHWDSRAGDPQLHAHVVIMNRAQCDSDGVWRSLDSRGLFKATVALSELYNGVLSDNLTQALGFRWEPLTRRHSTVPKWEIAGVSQALQAEFSQRSVAIEDAKNALIPEFVTAHGRQPSSREMLRLRQQATLQTRPDKHVHPLANLVHGWRERATGIVGSDPEAWAATLTDRNELPLLRCTDLSNEMLAGVGKVAVDTVAGKRATFTRSNVFAEVLRQLHGVRFASADDRIRVTERTTTLALDGATLISPPDLAHTPAGFRRDDGTSRFRARDHETYTTETLLDAEARLLDANRCADGPRLDPSAVTSLADTTVLAGRQLSGEQMLAVKQITTSGRVLDVLVGPAGTGKSSTMAGLRAAWEHDHGPASVIGLAPSATAAEVLAEQVGIPTENTAKWLTENTRNTQRLVRIDTLRREIQQTRLSPRTPSLHRQLKTLCAEVDRWSPRAGQLVIVDEASLAGTLTLDTLVTQTRDAGAKVVLVGDWAQLSPVEAGGAFHMLARDRSDVAELSDVRRFTHQWERQTSVDLRIGLPDAVDMYQAHGCVEGGDLDMMLERLYAAWAADTATGNRSLMIAGDNQTVLELNQRARADRVTAGQVEADGINTACGAVVGVGDVVVTRQNNRRLTSGTGWVKNGDQWIVTAAHPDGAVSVTRSGRAGTAHGHLTLPADYVQDHLDLGYATTAHGAQGRTVDTAHAYITATTSREVLYVGATRGRDSNKLYVDTCYDPDIDTAHQPPPLREAGHVLRQVLARPGTDMSATETIGREWADHHNVNRLWAEYQTLASTALRDRYDDLITNRSGLTIEQAETIRGSASYGALVAALANARERGLDVTTALPRLVAARTLTDADDAAAVVHERVDRWVHGTPRRRLQVPDRIVGLFPKVDAPTDSEMQQALHERQSLIERRTRELSEQAVRSRQSWVARLGRPPAEPVRRELWYRRLDTITAYREHWNITGPTTLGHASPGHYEQHAERRLAQQAADEAARLNGVVNDPGRPGPYPQLPAAGVPTRGGMAYGRTPPRIRPDGISTR